jgi:hypothetical protein
MNRILPDRSRERKKTGTAADRALSTGRGRKSESEDQKLPYRYGSKKATTNYVGVCVAFGVEKEYNVLKNA